jgi:guanylate kinase
VVLVLPPSRAAQEERLRGRGDAEESIAHRLAKADEEEATGRALADHVVINDDLGRAVDEVVGIVEAHRASPQAPDAPVGEP